MKVNFETPSTKKSIESAEFEDCEETTNEFPNQIDTHIKLQTMKKAFGKINTKANKDKEAII